MSTIFHKALTNLLLIGVGMLAWAQVSGSNYDFGPQAMLSLSGEGNSSNYSTFSVVEPINGLSITADENIEVQVGFIGSVGQNQAPTNLHSSGDLLILENQPVGTIVGEFNATDEDEDELIFSLLNGEGGEDNALFQMDANGTLRTAVAFDFESNATSYAIRVQARDDRNGSVDRNFTVLLVDEFEDLDGDGIEDHLDEDMDGDGFSNSDELAYGSNPMDASSLANAQPQALQVQGQGLSILENQPVGTIVGKFNATDEDGDELIFSLVNGEGGEGNALFQMDANGTLRTAVAFDFESNATGYAIRVQAKDDKNGSVDGNFTVLLVDEFEDLDGDGIEDHLDEDMDGDGFSNSDELAYGSNPMDASSLANAQPQALQVQGQGLSILENQPVGTIVGKFNATDEDGDELIFSLVNGEGGDGNALFQMDANGTLRTAVAFDFESNATSYAIRVQAKDDKNGSVDGNFTVLLLNDQGEDSDGDGYTDLEEMNAGSDPHDPNSMPEWLPENFSFLPGELREGQMVGTTVGIIEFDGLGSREGYIFALVANGNGSEFDNGSFEVDEMGRVLAKESLSLEGGEYRTIRVLITDPDGNQYATNLLITVLPGPSLTLSNMEMGEDSSIGSEVGSLQTDGIENPIFELLKDGGGRFGLDGNRIVTLGGLDYEENSTILIRVRVFGTTGESAEKAFTISLLDNDQEDADGDGLKQEEEELLGTSDLRLDTDEDGYADGVEVSSETDPLDPQSFPHLFEQADLTPPVISLIGYADVRIEAGSVYEDPGATWTDIVDGNGTLLGQGEINSLVPGVYQLTYSKSDEAGNEAASLTRAVTVVDTTAPEITLTGEPEIILEAGSAFIDPGATWTDIVDGNGTFLGQGEVDTMVPGVYELTYSISDEAGNEAITIMRTVTVVNDAPDSLVLSGNAVEENLAANTLVGQFSWSDPNDPGGTGNYQLELVNEEGKANFLLDENHTLLTRTSLDYETAPSHELVVRLSDAYGGSMEESFTIEVIDAFVPIVYTEDPIEVGARHVVASGEVMDDGHSLGVNARGFLVSSLAEARMEDAEVIHVLAGEGAGSYTHRVNGLQPDQKYYVRAYATNAEGTAYGASLRIYSQAYDVAPDWSNATPSAYVEGWWSSPWFGTFYTQDDSGWVHHAALGWAYAMPVRGDGVWLWTEATGWAWTEQGTYPFLYANDWQSWLYFYGQSRGQIIFFRYSDNEWLIKEKNEIK